MRFRPACSGGAVLPIVRMVIAFADAGAQAVPEISAKVVSTDMYTKQRASFAGGVSGLHPRHRAVDA